jgi:hypothetical protein
MNKKKQERKVIHLYIKVTDTHEYYGSISAIFEVHTDDEMGIKLTSLRNYVVSESNPYENGKIIIREGKLITKKKEI